MGRRKIEIKAIKDDRNRSVTFLKRKGGLFKKAHELAVLCSVDVAVIIFGHNKKLYEFSSGNINETLNRYSYVCQTYGGPHEHKGPEDFAGKGKGGDSDDEDDDAGSPRPESHSPPQPSLMQHHLQNQPAFQHLGTPSASPPLQNGQFHRGPSPAPQNISRPGSRTHFRQPSAHLVPPPPPPHHIPQYSSPQPPQGQFTHMAHPPMPMYSQQAGAGAMQVRPPSNPPHPSQFAYAQPPTTVPPQMPPQYMPPQQMPPQIQIQQAHPQPHAHVQEQRRQSMPQQPERLAVQIPEQAPPAPPPPSHSPPPPQPQEFHSPPLPQPRPLPSAVTHSIFTPIEASSSFLAQHFGKPSTSSSNDVKEERSPPDDKPAPSSRSLSIDTAMGERKEPNGIGLRPPIKVQPPQAPTSNPGLPAPQRTNSTPILNGPPQPPSRTNSLGPARPRLKVQIPAEQSDEEGTSKKSGSSGSPRTNVAATLTPIRENNIVHLPPPSPSASALLSAGATGPPNPFARPAPPTSTANGFRGELDTPMSALPSRFMSDQFLPSPSGFYSDFSFSRDNNMLPSPLAFPTPMNQNGPSFKDDEADKKRKMSDGHDGNAEKKVKA